jgi:hypothetical protein
VFPSNFNCPNLHALLHLSDQALTFGSLRNLSVSTKEMVHRLYKEAVPKTNKIHLLRDLTVYENDMQALRFLAEDTHNSMPAGDLRRIFSGGFFKSSYFESTNSIPAFKTNTSSGDTDFIGVYVKGRPWSSAHIESISGLPIKYLNDQQATELIKAYESIGIPQLCLNRAVSFYGGISYWVREDAWVHQHVKVIVGDIVECVVDGPDSSPAFARVIGIMVHEETAFFVLTWFARTGRIHPKLRLEEYEETATFDYTAFHPISIIDHPRFVNRIHLIQLEDRIWLNEWTFCMV